MRKKKVETDKRPLKLRRETVRLLSVSVADLQKVVGGRVPMSNADECLRHSDFCM